MGLINFIHVTKITNGSVVLQLELSLNLTRRSRYFDIGADTTNFSAH